MSIDVRIEQDSIGEVEVPRDALFGANTARVIANLGVSEITLKDRPSLLDAIIRVKVASARANVELGALAPDIGNAIIRAGREVLDGQWRDQFPIDVVQGGGGTATNMNVNEVLANRAGVLLGSSPGAYARVNPYDHVNRSQSTNDVYPTALQVAVTTLGRRAIVDFGHLADACLHKSFEFAHIERLGRTCLQDALPIGIDVTHRRQAHAITRGTQELEQTIDALLAVPLGATAVGSGFGSPPGYRERAVALLGDETGLPLVPSPDPYVSLAHLDPLLSVASDLVRVMLVIAQIAQDLRFLSSGPVGGIDEVMLQPVQVGSSMMPGKFNPVIPELVIQIGCEVRGARQTVEAAVSAGELELNVMEPVIAKHLLSALMDAGRVARVFADQCIAHLKWNSGAVDEHLGGSRATASTLAANSGWSTATDSADGSDPERSG